ncbi:MAG: S9 family peptidase [Gemmatimonadota bacterium]|nr:MAG: S9 family peptidase [Gemmatimonadota bacterium]
MRLVISLAALTLLAGLARAQQTAKQPLDHSAYDVWMGIDDETLSHDGRWLLYSLTLQDGDATLMVRALDAGTEHSLPRGAGARFSADANFVVALIKPELTLMREARRAKKQGDDLPKDSLALVNLATGVIERIARVRSFRLPEEQAVWLAYLLEREPEDTAAAEASGGEGQEEETKHKKPSEVGTTLVLRDLTSGDERRFEFVKDYAFSEDGGRLAYVTSTRDGEGDGVWVVALEAGTARQVSLGRGSYRSLTFDEDGRQLAFLTNRDDPDADQPGYALYHWREGDDMARLLGAEGTVGIPAGWWVSEHGALSFSPNGRRLFFGTAPRPEPAPKDTLLEEEKVDVDIWHWRDPYLQSMQQEQLDDERKRSYTAVADLRRNRIVQLATDDMPTIALGAKGDADVAIGSSDLPYRVLVSWDWPSYEDVYLVDARSGQRELLLRKTQANVRLSPNGTYAVWYDHHDDAWYARHTGRDRTVKLTAGIPHPLFDEDDDHPAPRFPYGSAGWTDDEKWFLVYDRHDVWATDPTGRAAPRNVTDGVGRRENLRFRSVRLEPDDEAIDPDAPLLLSAFHYRTKAAGFYRERLTADAAPERLVYMDRAFGGLRKAKDADVVVFSRESVAEFPNLWVSDLEFAAARQVTDANPQQSQYTWATVELVEWTSGSGVPLQGLVYRPENFDPSRKYPLIVQFYERDSDNLHSYHAPVPHRSVIRPTFYASRGYVVFMPDVRYRIGYPGESALHSIVPGTLKLVEQGFIDEANIGIQGHSWAGYQIAYIVTRTDLFKAAAGGAPVANMTSAYGGIRYGSGMSRMFQYERTQSRIGATLWDAPQRYIENSPLFWADKIETPLLMMHNDRDHAVPWTQGVEMFMALRRLDKPAWLVNYTGELHWPTDFAEKRDWNIRMQQYFDHYLRGAPPPVWLAEGISAVDKARTLGLELVEEQPVP